MQKNRLLLLIGFNLRNEISVYGRYLSAIMGHIDFLHISPHYLDDVNNEYSSPAVILKENGIANFERTIDKLIEFGVSPTKIIIGFNFGGMKIDVLFRTTSCLGYNEICEITSNQSEKWQQFFDSDASLALAKKKDNTFDFWRQVIVFENKRSIVQRIRIAIKRNLAGAMATFINTDNLHNNCQFGDEKYDFASSHVNITLTIPIENNPVPLLNTINLMMVMALYEIEQESKLSHENLLYFSE